MCSSDLVPEDMDQESVSRLFARHDLTAMPVVDATGRMKGIVTVDDIVDVVEEEATEDIQKIGGTEALDAPYLEIGMFEMIRKRAGWLAALFDGLDEDAETRRLVAATVAAEQVRRLQEHGVEEFHFYTLNRADLTYALCQDRKSTRLNSSHT